MKLNQKPIIADLRVFEAKLVSREQGRATLKRINQGSEITPCRTPNGRCYLAVKDPERLAWTL